MTKPRVFIGSSSEGLRLAEAVFSHLSHECAPKLWTHDLFLPGQYPLEVLEKQLRENSFAILVASPDDQVVKRGVQAPTMRDNLLLEFGLFTGALGRRRAFFLCPNSPKLELPSDLFGVVVAEYDASRAAETPDEIASAVQVPCQQIRAMIKEQWELIQKEREDFADQIRTSKKGKAVRRLHGAVVQLRNAVFVIQRDAFAVVSDEERFASVKKDASEKIQGIVESFADDAQIVGVSDQLESLAAATMDTLDSMPFPRELSAGDETVSNKLVDFGAEAVGEVLRGGDPFRYFERAVSDEIGERVSSLRERYTDWWDKHHDVVQLTTDRFQDKLFEAMSELSSD